MKFFSSSMRLHVIFFALQHSAGFFFCVDGVKKVGIQIFEKFKQVTLDDNPAGIRGIKLVI